MSTSHCNLHTNSEAWPKKIEIRLRPCKINCFQNSLGKKRAHYHRDKTTFFKINVDRKALNCKLLKLDFHRYEKKVIIKDTSEQHMDLGSLPNTFASTTKGNVFLPFP